MSVKPKETKILNFSLPPPPRNNKKEAFFPFRKPPPSPRLKTVSSFGFSRFATEQSLSFLWSHKQIPVSHPSDFQNSQEAGFYLLLDRTNAILADYGQRVVELFATFGGRRIKG
jgi:hypothetical protein